MEKKTKKLTFSELWMLGVGQVIGAGVITTIGPAIGMTGYSVWLAYLCAIVLGLIINLPIILFSSITKFSGGDYSVITNLAGEKTGGMFIISFFLQMLTMSLFATALGIYMKSLIPSLNPVIVAIVGVGIFYAINLLGTKNMAKIQKILSYILIACLFGFAVTGIAKGNVAPAFNFGDKAFFSGGLAGFISAMMILVYSCQGYKLNVNYGGMAQNPTKDLPRSMLAVIPVLVVLYCGAALADVAALPLDQVVGQPLTVAAQAIFSKALFYIFIIGGPIMALLTSMNSTFGMAVGPYMTATRDGWLPEIFGKTNKNGAPVLILTIQLVVAIIPVVLGFSVGTIVNNIMVVTSVFQLLLFYAVWQAPKKMPEKLKASSLHLTPTALRVVVIIATLAQLFILIYSLRSLTLPLAIFNIVAVIVCFAYAILRHKSGKTHVNTEGMFDMN